jgi:hypothetical protein
MFVNQRFKESKLSVKPKDFFRKKLSDRMGGAGTGVG